MYSHSHSAYTQYKRISLSINVGVKCLEISSVRSLSLIKTPTIMGSQTGARATQSNNFMVFPQNFNAS